MITAQEELAVTRQCELLDVPRSTVYYRPQGVSQEDVDLMARIDQIHLDYPFLGSRRIADILSGDGWVVNRKRIQRLMRIMGITAIYPKKRTSVPGAGHKIYPYLLRGLSIERAGHVWCADITYLPMASGFLYLVAIMDWYSRKVLAWRLSNTMDETFCIEALTEALEIYGVPEIYGHRPRRSIHRQCVH